MIFYGPNFKRRSPIPLKTPNFVCTHTKQTPRFPLISPQFRKIDTNLTKFRKARVRVREFYEEDGCNGLVEPPVGLEEVAYEDAEADEAHKHRNLQLVALRLSQQQIRRHCVHLNDQLGFFHRERCSFWRRECVCIGGKIGVCLDFTFCSVERVTRVRNPPQKLGSFQSTTPIFPVRLQSNVFFVRVGTF